ncbi:hypothetical protein CLOM_g19422 [Closterium sp. NIES-68]|nr:hypothetical protein CLOM_g19422 [Closterium sp. NIES-68]GJP76921.1 hypothetical protein CLOP_g7367 [Closterium sp. NIES-67]
MSFWGVEVKAGETVVVDPTEHDFDYIHLSQASLGESAKDHERVVLRVRQVEFPESSDDDDDEDSDDSDDSDDGGDGGEGNGKKAKDGDKSKSFAVGPEVVLGVLVKGRVDFAAMDHIFDRQFSLSHSGSHSVFFSGYKTSDSGGDGPFYDEDEDDEEEEDSDEDDEDEEDEGEEAMEASDDEEAAAAAMAAEKSSKGMAAAATAAVEKRARIKAGRKGTPGQSPGPSKKETPSKEGKEATPKKEGKVPLPGNGREATPKKEPVAGSKRAAVTIATPPSSKGKGEKTTERKKHRPDTPAAVKTAAKLKTPATVVATPPSSQKSPTPVPNTSPATPKTGSFPCTTCPKRFTSPESLASHVKAKHRTGK